MTNQPSPSLRGKGIEPSISDLIAKLEGAEVGSRELDVAIWAALQPGKIKVVDFNPPFADQSGQTQVGFTLPPKRTREVTRGVEPYRHAQPVTTSLDAALVLVARKLPGHRPMLWQNVNDDGWGAHFRKPDTETTYAPSPALAIVCALLKALEAGE